MQGEKRMMNFTEQSSGKRTKVNNPTSPSRVVFLRNVPAEVTEAEILSVCQVFGNVLGTFFVRNKGQAFVEFDNELAAASFVTQFQLIPLNIRGHLVSVQISQRQTVTKADFEKNVGTETQNRIILCSFTNIQNLPVAYSLDSLFSLFSRFGHCQRIVRFNNKGSFRALVQYETTDESAAARSAIDGQSLMDGTVIRVGYSSLSELEMKSSDGCKDFDINPPNLQVPPLILMSPLSSKAVLSQASHFAAAQQQIMNSANLLAGQPVQFFPQREMYGDMIQGGGFGSNFQTGVSPAMQPVVLINGVSDRVNPDTLFSLFGVYGDVIRVKILFQKRDCALVQFSNDQQAQTAVCFLDGVSLFGSTLRVQLSNKNEVKVPREGESKEADLNKDFTYSPLHRFKIPGSRNFQNIAPPSHVLHITNLHPDTTEEEIRSFFGSYGQVQDVRMLTFENKPRKMALVSFTNIGAATDCLVQTDGKQIKQCVIRVNYAKPRNAVSLSSHPDQ